jgi:flagellar protein FlaG
MIDRITSNQFSLPQKITTNTQEVVTIQQPEKVTPEETKESLKEENLPLQKEKIEEIVQGMNKFLQPTQTSLKFEFHEKLNEYYVKIIDDKTKETVREIPPKKLLDMYAAMTEFLGLIVDKKI